MLTNDNDRPADANRACEWKIFLTAFVTGLIVYGYEITRFTLSIDEESDSRFYASLTIGRWGQSLLHGTIFPDPFIPYFTALVSVVLLAITPVILNRLFNFPLALALLAAVLFIAMPQLAYQMQFATQSDSVALGYCLAVFGTGLLILPGATDRFSPKAFIAATLLFVLVLSFYQSLILVPIVLLALYRLHQAFNENKTGLFINRHNFYLFLSLVVAVPIHTTISWAFQRYYAVPYSNYLAHYVTWNADTYLNNIIVIARTILSSFSPTLAEYGMGIYGFTLFPLAFILIKPFFDKGKSRPATIAFFALFATITPFLLTIALGGGQLPRQMLAMPIFFAIITCIALARLRENRKLYAAIAIATVYYATWHVTVLFHSDWVAREIDKVTATQIMNRLQTRFPEFNALTDQVYFFGGTREDNYARKDNFDTFGRSFFFWDGGSTFRIRDYMKLAGFPQPILPNHLDTMRAINDDVIKMNVPIWPHAESIVKIRDVYVIRLGEKAGHLP